MTADFLTIDGGLISSEQSYPSYYHRGSDEYNTRISSGAETKAQLDAEIAVARLNVIGINFSDQHNDVSNTNSKIVNCIVENCSMGINYGRTNGATIKNTMVTNCGAVQKYYHGLYLSTVDNLLIDGLNASNNVTGMGLKICDFYGTETESSIIVQNCTLNNNYDRGMAIYDMNNVTVYDNTAKGNTKTGINLIGCSNVSMTYNTATGNGYVVNSAYDIWLNGCTGVTQNNNTYGTKSGF